MDETLQKLHSIFSDISRGYSSSTYKGQEVYLKHITHHDQVLFDSIYSKHFYSAKSRGVPTEEERLEFLISGEGSWTKDDEKFIQTHRERITSMENGKKNLILEKQIKKHTEEIKTLKAELQERIDKKKSLLGSTCESFANARCSDYYVSESFYYDKEFKQKVISSPVDDVDDEVIIDLTIIYNNLSSNLSDSFIKKLAIQDFFMSYWDICMDDTYKFFGKPIVELTYYQVRLATYANRFKSLLKEYYDAPLDVRSDPDKLMDYATGVKNAAKHMDKSGGKSVSLVGGTDEDYKKLGVDMDSVVKPSDVLKKSGKKQLSMQDLMKLEGL